MLFQYLYYNLPYHYKHVPLYDCCHMTISHFSLRTSALKVLKRNTVAVLNLRSFKFLKYTYNPHRCWDFQPSDINIWHKRCCFILILITSIVFPYLLIPFYFTSSFSLSSLYRSPRKSGFARSPWAVKKVKAYKTATADINTEKRLKREAELLQVCVSI